MATPKANLLERKTCSKCSVDVIVQLLKIMIIMGSYIVGGQNLKKTNLLGVSKPWIVIINRYPIENLMYLQYSCSFSTVSVHILTQTSPSVFLLFSP